MRSILVFALICLAFSVHAMTENDIQAAIQRMQKTRYGKTLLATIDLQLSAEGPVEDLIRLLQSSEDDLRNEQSQDDDLIFALQEQCDVELANLVSEIKAANERIGVLTRELNEKIPIRDEKQVEESRKKEFRSLVNQKIDELDSNKALKDQEWAEEQRQHDEALSVIEKAKEIIVQAMQSSFLQRQEKTSAAFVQVTSHLVKHSKSNFKRKSWNSIFKLLSQITSYAPVQADASAVERVVGLCDELIEKIAQSREIEKKDYEHWVNEYQTTRDELSAKVEELTGEINQLQSEIDTLTKRINEATNEKHDTTQRRDQKQAEHDARLTYCDQENVNYSNRRQSRQDELENISDAIALLQSNLRLFRQFVAQRTETVQKAN